MKVGGIKVNVLLRHPCESKEEVIINLVAWMKMVEYCAMKSSFFCYF